MRISDWSSDVCSSDLIGKLGSCIRDGSRWRAFSDQFAQSFGRLLSGGGQVAFQFFARLSEGDAIALPLGWRAVGEDGNPGGTDARLGREAADRKSVG